MGERFTARRRATEAEITALLNSVDVTSPPPVLWEAEISDVPTVDDLGSLRTVLERTEGLEPGTDAFLSIAEAARRFDRTSQPDDLERYSRALKLAQNPAFSPEVLIEPYRGDDWRVIDGIHRAAALFTTWKSQGKRELRLRVYVLPRPLFS